MPCDCVKAGAAQNVSVCNFEDFAMAAAGSDVETIILCDAGGAFLRHRAVNGGGVVTVANTLLDGTTNYIPVGTATNCRNDNEYVILCDEILPGQSVKFLRRLTNNNGFFQTFDTELDGITSYVVQGVEVVCPESVTTWDRCMEDDVNGDGSVIVKFVRIFAIDVANGNTYSFNRTAINGVLYTIQGTVSECPEVEGLVGYIRECVLYENTLPINSGATFDDSPVGTNVIILSNANIALLLRTEIARALEVEQEQIKHSLAVTSFVVNGVGGEIYSFNPSALQVASGTTLTVDETGIVAWGANQTEDIETVAYSTFDSCECSPVKLIERHEAGVTYLVDIIDPNQYDATTRVEQSLLTNGLLPFGTTGPFAGPCPIDDQVLALDSLCCNDNILSSNPILANNFDAWLDAATVVTNILDTTGVPIAGAGGERVGEILNPLGVGPSWDGQGPVPGPVPNGGPRYELNQQNGLPALVFDGNPFPAGIDNGDHLELSTGTVKGSPFQFFFLASFPPTTDSTIAFGSDVPVDGNENWQLQFDAGTDDMYLRYRGTSAVLNDVPFATHAELANGVPHLITVTYEGTTTNILKIFVDGELRLDFDIVANNPGDPGNPCALESDLIGIMRNNGDNGFAAGSVFESIYTGTSLTSIEIAEINAYLICKWGIDPSLAAGGAGDLTLANDGSYNASTPFVRIEKADGSVIFRNTLNGQEFPLPPVPGLSICGDAITEDPPFVSVSAAGNTMSGVWEVSISNVGGVGGVVDGAAFPAGASFTHRAYVDGGGNEHRIGSIAYDATGTTFLITELP